MDTGVIRLDGCPPDLLLAHDDNLADIARELRLYGASHADPEASRSAEQIAEVVRLPRCPGTRPGWSPSRRPARASPSSTSRSRATRSQLPRRVELLREAVLRAEAMAEQGLLMTMPAPPAVQEWRDWAEVEMVEQAWTGRGPRSFARHRAGGLS